MVSPSNSAVAIDDPKGLGNQLWQRVQGVPLVARPSSPGSMRDNRYRFAGNLANEVFSRYLGGTQGAYYPGNKLPLHLHVMRKVRSGWNAPLEIAAGLAMPSVATVLLSRNSHNPSPLMRPLRLFNALHGSAISAASHENSGARPLSSPTLREAVEPAYERPQHGDSDMRPPIVYPAERAESAEAADLTRPVGKRTVGDIGSIVSNSPAQMSPVASISKTRIFASGHSPFLPDVIFMPTKTVNASAALVTKRALGQHRQFTPLSTPPGLRLHRMRRNKAAERDSSTVDRFSTGSSEQLSSSFHAHRSLAVSQSRRTGLASVSGRYPLLANTTAVSGVPHPAATSIERSIGTSSIPVDVQGLRSEASATSGDSHGAVRVGSPRNSMLPIHRSIMPSRIRYRRLAEAMLADSGTLLTQSYLPLQAKMTMGSDAGANLISQHSLRSSEVIGRETPAPGGGLAMMPASPVRAIPFMALTPRIRHQPMVMSMRRLGHRSVEEPFGSLPTAVSVSNSDSNTRAGSGEVRLPYAVSVARMTANSAESSPSPPHLVLQPVAARHAGAASTSSSRDIVSLAADSNAGAHGGEAPAESSLIVARTPANNARQVSSAVPQPTLHSQIKVTAGSLRRNLEVAGNHNNLLMRRADFTPSARSEMPFVSAKRSAQPQLITGKAGSHFLQPVLQSSMRGQALATLISMRREAIPLLEVSYPGAYASYGTQTAMLLPRSGVSSSQGRLENLQRLRSTQSTVSDIGSLHKPESMATEMRSQMIASPAYLRRFSLDQRGIAASSATLNKRSAAADMRGSLRRSWSSPPLDSAMPLVSKKVIARIPAHSEQGVSGLQQLGSPVQLQAAAVSSEGGGERATNSQTQTAAGQTEGATPPQTDLEALADKLWQKIQRKLTVERERRGLTSWPV